MGRQAKGDELRVLHVALHTETDKQPAQEKALRTLGPYAQLDYFSCRHTCNEKLVDLARDHAPDLIFMQVQDENVFTRDALTRARKASPGVKIINWCGDVRTEVPRFVKEIGPELDLQLLVHKHEPTWEAWRKAGAGRIDYLQIGFNPEIYYPDPKVIKTRDIVFLGNNYNHFPLSGLREEMVYALKEHFGDRFEVYGNWPAGISSGVTKSHEHEAQIYREAKIAIGISAFDYPYYTSDRAFRAMGCGLWYVSRHFERAEKVLWPEATRFAGEGTEGQVNLVKRLLTLALDNWNQEYGLQSGFAAKWTHTYCTWQHRIEELKRLL